MSKPNDRILSFPSRLFGLYSFPDGSAESRSILRIRDECISCLGVGSCSFEQESVSILKCVQTILNSAQRERLCSSSIAQQSVVIFLTLFFELVIFIFILLKN